MWRYLSFIFVVQICMLLVSCQNNGGPTAEHEHDGTSVTLWTDNTELFMEYPALVVGQEAAFAVHLTDLKDFKPVTRGKLTCIFSSAENNQVTSIAEAPSYPGIFRPSVTFMQPGEYEMELRLQGSQVSDVIRVNNVTVYPDENSIPHQEEMSSDEELISFLKEQQWKIDFRTEPVQKRVLSTSIRVVGEILPKLQMHAEVPAPVNGVILADQNTSIPDVGTWIQKGDVLAVISPPANSETSLNQIRSEYLIAEAEYERAQRLYEKEAISQKRLQEAELIFESRKASYDVIAQQADFESLRKGDGFAPMRFHLKSPIDGIVQEIHFNIGQNVQAGEKLVTVTNPSSVFLKANVPVARISQIKHARDASFKVEGYQQRFTVSEMNGKLISIGSIVDEKSRTVPLTFQLDNPENILKIGMFAEIWVETGEIVDTLALPNSAIFDDSGTPVAYVHVEGESFAKRILNTGIRDDGYTQIISGVSEGERVVIVGGYQVRLASLSTSVPVGHGHEH